MICLFLLSSAWAASINGDISIEGDVTCNTLDSPTITTEGSIVIDSSLVTETLSSTYVSTSSLSVSKLKSSSGTIEVEGNIVLKPQDSSSATFFQKTWTLEHQDTFEESHKAWSTTSRDTCNEIYYIQGDCKTPEISKTFELSDHKYVRLVGIIHLLDLWNGERVEIKVDGKTVWSRVGRTLENGVNVCGKEHPDPGFSNKFDVMVPHQSPKALLTFTSNLSEKNCHASFAISEVALLTR